MNLEQIRELVAYSNWANVKILDYLHNVNEENINRPLNSSFSSIKDTLVHIIGVEELWLSRWQGEEGRSLLVSEQFAEFGQIKERWQLHIAQLNEYMHSLQEEQLPQLLHYKNISGVSYALELWKQIVHLVNHSTQHRGQIQTMLRQLGHQPPSADLIYYFLGER